MFPLEGARCVVGPDRGGACDSTGDLIARRCPRNTALATTASEPTPSSGPRLEAAQGDVVHNDDTTAKILAAIRARGPDPVSDRKSRTGTYTTGIVSRLGEGGRRVGLFFTGHQHAGENLAKVLAERAAELCPPLHICDGLAHNTAGDFETIVGNCIAHARRYYVKIVDAFPEACRFVLEELREVYRVDARARREGLDDHQRLALHRTENGRRMARLKKWLYLQVRDKRVEPNSALGEAITYMRTHWKRLVLFLRKPGAPLDNTVSYAGRGITWPSVRSSAPSSIARTASSTRLSTGHWSATGSCR